MTRSPDTRIRNWGIAWIGLAAALALHVADEALTGFLPLYNSLIESLRDTLGWVPFPTFTFPVWLGGLVTGVILLLALSPLVFQGRSGMRIASYVLGVIMIANAIGHFSASIYLGEVAPGAFSSPILLMAAITLVVTATRSRRQPPPGPNQLPRSN